MRHSRRVVLVLGERWPAKAVSFLEPVGSWDSGFMVVLEDVPEPEELSGDERSHPFCLACLLDEHPEVGSGLDLARVHGQVVWDDDGWVPRD